MFIFISTVGETGRKKTKDNNGSLSWEDNREVFKSVHGEEVKNFEGIMVISIGAK